MGMTNVIIKLHDEIWTFVTKCPSHITHFNSVK